MMEWRNEQRKKDAEQERMELERKLEKAKQYNDWLLEKKRQDFTKKEQTAEQKRKEFEQYLEQQRWQKQQQAQQKQEQI